MQPIVLKLVGPEKRGLKKVIRKTNSAGERCRALIILAYAEGKKTREVADMIRYDPSAVRKVRARYLTDGKNAIYDRRAENGQPKVDEDLLEALRQILEKVPTDFGYARSSWTQELLSLVLCDQTDVQVSPSTVGRMLRKIGARLGSPKPIVLCPWKKAQRKAKLRELRRLVANVPENEVVLFEDEVDIDLNPRIGRDWMLPGTQRLVVTPGKNEKHYLAGALDSQTGRIHWIGNGRKNTYLFVLLLRSLAAAYPRAKRIHLILDNYIIHKSKVALRVLEKEFERRIVLHFLPPYCPDDNRIEKLWKELHANVTRNHRCTTLKQLLAEANRFLENAAPFPGTKVSTLKKAA